MYKHLPLTLKIAAAVLAIFFLSQAAKVSARRDPLAEFSFNPTPLSEFQPKTETNKTAAAVTNNAPSASVPPQMPSAMMGMGRPGKVELPPELKTRVDKIVQSEILGQVMRPPPMALIGLAGDHAIIRGPNGQTGLVKPGEIIDGIKLIKMGVNRVLIEQDNQQKELTIFSGFGSETLLPKGK